MTTTSEPTFDQNLSMIVSQLPPPVRAFFVSGKVEIVTKNLIQKYQLHIDQGAVVDREIILLLLGLRNLAEFSQTLATEVHLDKKIIDSIVQDINTQIFVPLREGVRQETVVVPQSRPPVVVPPQRVVQPRPINASVPKYAPPAPTPMGSYAPPLQSPMYSRPITMPPPSNFTQKNFARPVQPVRPPVSNAFPARPAMLTPKPMDNRKLLEDHEEPHIEFKKAPASVPMRSSYSVPRVPSDVPKREANPARVMPPPTAGFPKGSVPPNLPGAMPPSGVIPPGGRPTFAMPHMPETPAPIVTSRPIPPAPPVPPQKTPAPPAPKSYSTDPYREPIDEK